jgi:NADPH-dependent 2,4-dienoyl-CoA reductase/sulfur reductase-like enzyme/nitrite reductase/ring-hydroxylating ferredoxin subunit
MSDEAANDLDFRAGVALTLIADGAMLSGHVDGEAALLIRRGDRLFAIGAHCTHYGAPLHDGLLVDATIRCPWHHACFSLHTGEPLRAPALDPLPRWRVEELGGVVFVREKLKRVPRAAPGVDGPASVVIVGGGAAGNAAAETLRREGFAGPITILSADDTLPCDRPNLSKTYLAGDGSEEFTLLRSHDFYRENGIDVRLNARVTAIDVARRSVELLDGSIYGYGALLLATGAEPVRLNVPGANLPHVRYLRSLADARRLSAAARTARHALVIGAGFVGLEVAASLRAHDIAVDVVAPGAIPMERVLGAQVGTFLRDMHEDHGVTFHLGATVTAIDPRGVTLNSGERIPADLVIVGIGARPATDLAERAGLAVDNGVLVDAFLETSTPGIFAAGDIARWPDPATGERLRIEHFVVAERQGQTAARNMLGRREAFDDIPFFWTEQYDLGIAYVGHAEKWDAVEIDGVIAERDCAVTYRAAGRKQALALIHRDLDGLRAEVAFERGLPAHAAAGA